VKIRTVVGLTGATAASFVGLAGLAASPAGAGGNGAINLPAADLTSTLGLPAPIFASPFVPAGAFPDAKVTGNCAQGAPWLFTDMLGLDFSSGNAVIYRGLNGVVFPFLPNGLNAVGVATLVEFPSDGATPGQTFVGPAHVWFGQNANAKGTVYAGETVSFSGTATDGSGSTISFNANPGFIQSAGGHQGGWGQQNLSCNIVPSG